jgi:hypothetical protein
MSDMQKDEELDRMLMRIFGPPESSAAHAESIEPSSGFVASVMDRVREEATLAASPIRFPWGRAVPGICMALLAIAVSATVLVFAVTGAVRLASRAFLSTTTQGAIGNAGVLGNIGQWADIAARLHLGWLVLGLVIAFIPVTISRSLVGRGHRV